ncbi:MAG: RNA-directed DNA polymerase [Gammaproteobacteria bacterium]|nr:RNA-directed DNA polymerase [Gammaproteobacteria bacterium]
MKSHQVSSDALDWAIQHIGRHGDTDIFPVPFEFDVLAKQWNSLKSQLASTHIGQAKMRPHLVFEVPKMTFGFRIAHQLDPIDALIYAALVYEMGEAIEAARLPADVVCSYRFRPSTHGDFYPQDSGWQVYADRSRQYADTHTHILYIDIADFYNQVNHHRVTGSLETCGISSPRARNVEKFLSRFTAKQSRGLPVGPSGSHLLAESCLTDIDSFLKQAGVPFVRYTDDFRVFADSKTELTSLLQRLTRFLSDNHGLALQTGKTEIENTNNFIRARLSDPGHTFNEQLDGRLMELAEFLSELSEEMGYGTVSLEEISDQDVAQEASELLVDSFKQILEKKPARLGPLKSLVRKARAWRSVNLLPLVLDELDVLLPIMGDVCRYIHAVCPDNHNTVADRLITAIGSSDYVSCDYIAMWVLELFAQRPDLNDFQRSLSFAQEYESTLGLRPQALLARAHKEPYWVRSHKSDVANLRPWDRRAVIYAASALPQSERNAWLSMVRKLVSDPIDAAVAKSI